MYRCEPGKRSTQGVASTEQLMRRDSRYSAFGGNILVEAGAEVIFPLPFNEDQRSMQSSFFIEGGNVFSDNCRPQQLNCYSPSVERISVSAGFGLTWITGRSEEHTSELQSRGHLVYCLLLEHKNYLNFLLYCHN